MDLKVTLVRFSDKVVEPTTNKLNADAPFDQLRPHLHAKFNI